MGYKITCTCGKEIELIALEPFPGQEGDKFGIFCPKCKRKWVLEDVTAEYEEMVVNGVIDPLNGEYLGKDNHCCFCHSRQEPFLHL